MTQEKSGNGPRLGRAFLVDIKRLVVSQFFGPSVLFWIFKNDPKIRNTVYGGFLFRSTPVAGYFRENA